MRGIKTALKQLCPPIIWNNLKFLRSYYQSKHQLLVTKSNLNIDKKAVACHFAEPFVSHTGDIYPCCRVWSDESKKIGHISDSDILKKMENFSVPCQCEVAALKRWTSETIAYIGFETPLSCNAACAMCCVHAPEWKDTFSLYDDYYRFIKLTQPKRISVQGGEVLVQKKSLQWLLKVRHDFPELQIHLITNGNAQPEVYDQVKSIFTTMTVSIVGFQELTYQTIMKLHFNKTEKFVDMILSETQIPLSLKFLITPSNMHEAGAFCDWVANKIPDSIQFVDAWPLEDAIVEGLSIGYWETIIERSGESLRRALEKHAPQLSDRKCKVYVGQFAINRWGISQDFCEAIGLETYVPYA